MFLNIFLLVLIIANVNCQFEIPDAIVEAYTPSGFKVSIPGRQKIFNL